MSSRRPVSRYTVIKAVGKGTFGTVYEAEESTTGRIVAVKKVFQDKNYKVCASEVFLREEPRIGYHAKVEASQHCDII